MRKLLVAVVAVIVLVWMLPSALAQDQITLGSTNFNTLKFTGDGFHNFTLSLRNNKIGGLAFGEGVFLGDNGFYSLTQVGTITGTFTSAVGCTICTWSITQANPIGFNFTQNQNGTGTQWLSGNLQLVSLTQSGVSGQFNDQLVANLSNLGGVLASQFTASGGVVRLDLTFNTSQSIASLAAGSSVLARIGEGSVTPTPEPGTMALLGSGLLFVAGYLRKRVSV